MRANDWEVVMMGGLPDVPGARYSFPAMGAPMFLVSTPALVIAQCRGGILGSYPALNARTTDAFRAAVQEVAEGVGGAPFAVNLIVNRSNERLEADLDVIVEERVPVVVTSLGLRTDVIERLHGAGVFVLHDVINDRFARKAVGAGVDGIIAVAAGAGGHAGSQSPFALVDEIRQWYAGTVGLSGAIATGRAILAAQVAGADFAYIGSAFLAATESGASDAYKAMVIDATASSIVTTDLFSGHSANYLRASIEASGLDAGRLPTRELAGELPKAWREIWSAGQGIGRVTHSRPAAAIIDELAEQYREACEAVKELHS